jgi:hypothetical protein
LPRAPRLVSSASPGAGTPPQLSPSGGVFLGRERVGLATTRRDYDPVALAVLVIGMGMIALLALLM